MLECGCTKASLDEATHWGNETVVLSDRPILARIQGRTVEYYGGVPLCGVLVEVLDHPERLSAPEAAQVELLARQERVAACVTDRDGCFGFDGIRPGKYELRCSKLDWDVTCIEVQIRKSTDRRAGQLSVPLQQGL